VTKLALFAPGDPDGFGDALYVQFIDQNTGYLVVRRATSTNFALAPYSRPAMAVELDPPDPFPIGDPIHFTSESTGWVAGGASGEELYQTRMAAEAGIGNKSIHRLKRVKNAYTACRSLNRTKMDCSRSLFPMESPPASNIISPPTAAIPGGCCKVLSVGKGIHNGVIFRYPSSITVNG
jgi:hypothetical protein